MSWGMTMSQGLNQYPMAWHSACEYYSQHNANNRQIEKEYSSHTTAMKFIG